MTSSVMKLLISLTLLHLLPTTLSQHFLEYFIHEELPPNTFVGNLVTDDGFDQRFDSATVSTLRFSFLTQPHDDRRFFTVEERSGLIHTTQRIDREKICAGLIDCVAQFDVVVKPQQFFQIIKVKIEIVDVNDNAPEFPKPRYTEQISEAAELNTALTLPVARDPDSGRNGIYKYDLISTTSKFQLHVVERADGGRDLSLMLKEGLDRETEDSYQMIIVAVDGGDPPKSGSVIVDIIVTDVNDNSPQFTSATYETVVLENQPVGTVIAKVKAKDPDLGQNGQVVYQLSRHSAQEFGHLFGVRPDSGKVYLKAMLDYETSTTHRLTVTVTDQGPDHIPAHVTVVVRVDDVNDNPPEITVKTLTPEGGFSQVEENSEAGTFVAMVKVKDVDSGENGKTRCELENDGKHFSPSATNSTDFRITTTRALDREEKSEHEVMIKCMDNGVPQLTSSVRLIVKVTDVNDNSPKFTQDMYVITVQENGAKGQPLIQVRATDPDESDNAKIRYWLESNVTSFLQVDPITGLISSLVSFDREQRDIFLFRAFAADGSGEIVETDHKGSRTATTMVQINVGDVDDEPPVFELDEYVFEVPEDIPRGSEVGRVKAEDRDSGGEIIYSLISNHPKYRGLFQIDSRTGSIILKGGLDRESDPAVRLTVTASCGDQHARSLVEVRARDVNDNPPRFAYPRWGNETVAVSSQTPVGFAVTQLKAIDMDEGENARINYFLTNSEDAKNIIVLDQKSGAISVKKDLTDIEFQDILLKVRAADGGQPSQESHAELRIVVSKDIEFIPPTEAAYEDLMLKDGILAIVLSITLSITILAITAVAAAIVCLFRQRGVISSHRQGSGKVRDKVMPINSAQNGQVNVDMNHRNGGTWTSLISATGTNGLTPTTNGVSKQEITSSTGPIASTGIYRESGDLNPPLFRIVSTASCDPRSYQSPAHSSSIMTSAMTSSSTMSSSCPGSSPTKSRNSASSTPKKYSMIGPSPTRSVLSNGSSLGKVMENSYSPSNSIHFTGSNILTTSTFSPSRKMDRTRRGSSSSGVGRSLESSPFKIIPSPRKNSLSDYSTGNYKGVVGDHVSKELYVSLGRGCGFRLPPASYHPTPGDLSSHSSPIRKTDGGTRNPPSDDVMNELSLYINPFEENQITSGPYSKASLRKSTSANWDLASRAELIDAIGRHKDHSMHPSYPIQINPLDTNASPLKLKDDLSKPVIVFVKDQAKLEEEYKTNTSSYMANGSPSRRQKSSNQPHLPPYQVHTAKPNSSVPIYSTLPLRTPKGLERMGGLTPNSNQISMKLDRPRANQGGAVWPKMTDKVYSMEGSMRQANGGMEASGSMDSSALAGFDLLTSGTQFSDSTDKAVRNNALFSFDKI